MYIVGGRILTMAGREIPEGILQIRNGKIAQVGARGEVKLQPEEGEQVVIAKNSLIMPAGTLHMLFHLRSLRLIPRVSYPVWVSASVKVIIFGVMISRAEIMTLASNLLF
mgnify:CR=1 FL=1